MYGRRFVAGSVALLVIPIALTVSHNPARADEPAAQPAAAARPAGAADPAAGSSAPSGKKEGFQLELGLFGGAHIFANNLELGVPDAAASPHPKTGAEFGLRVAGTLLPWLSLEGEVAGIPSADSVHNYSIWLMTYKVHALVHLMHGNLRPFVLAGVNWMQVASNQPEPGPTEIGPDTDFGLHAGAGVKYAVTDQIDLRGDARVVFLPNTNHNSDSADLELLAGASFRFGGDAGAPPPPPPPLVKDTDRDDIPDNVDKCPNEPEDKDGFQDDDGCPDPDNDNDGIVDAKDKCPLEAEDKDGFQDDDGCPDPDNDHDGIPDVDDACPNDPEDGKGKRPYDGCPSTLEDSDGDGVPDVKDKCPDEPEDKDGFQDEDGCPDTDNDNDGIPDIYDACPNEPEDMDGFEDNDGCPDLDNDKDGIPDKKDKCPNQPETLNGYRDDDGCPDPGPEIVVLRDDKIDILDRITFVSGQTELSPTGLTIVKLVAMVMRGHGELARVRIDVRAEGVAEATMRGRAQEVAKQLAAHGVDAKRLKQGNVSTGSGRVQFIIENRVALKVIKPPMPGVPSAPEPPAAPSPETPQAP